VADFICQLQFLRDVAEWEKTASPRDKEALVQILAAIVADPELRGRIPSFYDPQNPSYLYRGPSFVVHYRVSARGKVEFVNLFRYVRYSKLPSNVWDSHNAELCKTIRGPHRSA
jgi:hypothetical protein